MPGNRCSWIWFCVKYVLQSLIIQSLEDFWIPDWNLLKDILPGDLNFSKTNKVFTSHGIFFMHHRGVASYGIFIPQRSFQKSMHGIPFCLHCVYETSLRNVIQWAVLSVACFIGTFLIFQCFQLVFITNSLWTCVASLLLVNLLCTSCLRLCH
jgi:hypothetical protein